MGKIYKIKAAAPNRPRTLQEGLQAAAHSGVLEVPAGMLHLTVDSGIKLEEAENDPETA